MEEIADRISKAGMNNVVVKPRKEGLCGRNPVNKGKVAWSALREIGKGQVMPKAVYG